MDPRTQPGAIAGQYYDAWTDRAGDMTDVPLAKDFVFTGPVACFDTADGYREMARQAGAAVRRFQVRHQFFAGDLVCSIVDLEMDPLPGTLTAAEVLHIRDGEIVQGELIYDAEDLRRAMATMAGQTDRTGLVDLLRRGYAATADLIGQIPADKWVAASPCAGWTVRQVANHLSGGLQLITRIAEGQTIEPEEFDAQRHADTDGLGTDPAAGFRAVTERSLAVFGKPDTMEQEFPFTTGPAPGAVLATVSLLESLVHGWDIAHGAGVGYPADDDVVKAVWAFAADHVGDECSPTWDGNRRASGVGGQAPPTPAPPRALGDAGRSSAEGGGSKIRAPVHPFEQRRHSALPHHLTRFLEVTAADREMLGAWLCRGARTRRLSATAQPDSPARIGGGELGVAVLPGGHLAAAQQRLHAVEEDVPAGREPLGVLPAQTAMGEDEQGAVPFRSQLVADDAVLDDPLTPFVLEHPRRVPDLDAAGHALGIGRSGRLIR